MGYFTDLLVDSAVLKTVNGTDSNDKPIIIAEDKISCKIEFKNSVSVGKNGQELTSSGRLFTENIVKVGDFLVIDDKEYKVVNVNPYYPLCGSVLVVNEVSFL